MQAPLRVAIVEDQRETREGLATLVDSKSGYQMVGAFRSMEDAIGRLEGVDAHVILADIGLPGMSGIEGIRHLKARWPHTEIVVLTVYDDNDNVFEAICAGACGYLLKDTPPAKLLDAIREAAAGGAPMSPGIARKVVKMFQTSVPRRNDEAGLTTRELEVLQLLAEGHTYKTAADALFISLDTLRFHIRNIYEKLHVHSKSDAVLKALKSGLVR